MNNNRGQSPNRSRGQSRSRSRNRGPSGSSSNSNSNSSSNNSNRSNSMNAFNRNNLARQTIEMVNQSLQAFLTRMARLGNNSTIRNHLQHSYNRLQAFQEARRDLNRIVGSNIARHHNLRSHPRIQESRRMINSYIQREARRAQMLLRAYQAVSSIARGLRETGRRRI